MIINVLRDFVAFGVTYPAGKPAELPDDVAERAIGAGWAEAEEPEAEEPEAEEPEAEEPEAEEPEHPKHTGGGYYELSDGSKVKGKKAAVEAQAALDAEKESSG